MNRNSQWKLAVIRSLVLTMVLCGVSLVNVSCSSEDEDSSLGPKSEQGFFTNEINDYYMERTAMLNIWYVYFALTGTPLSTEELEKLKENEYYAKGELLVEAYK